MTDQIKRKRKSNFLRSGRRFDKEAALQKQYEERARTWFDHEPEKKVKSK